MLGLRGLGIVLGRAQGRGVFWRSNGKLTVPGVSCQAKFKQRSPALPRHLSCPAPPAVSISQAARPLSSTVPSGFTKPSLRSAAVRLRLSVLKLRQRGGKGGSRQGSSRRRLSLQAWRAA